MKSHSRYFIILGILIVACTKIDDKSLSVPNLPLQNSDLIIDISTTRSAGNILGYNSDSKTRAMGDDPFTEIREVECFESVVLPELQPHIWIGNIMTKGSIVNCVYKPLIYPRTPINVSLTLPGTSPQEIQTPSYSQYLSYVQEQIGKGTFSQNDEFNFSIEQFTSYHELKVAFGSNANTNAIFLGSSSESSRSEHMIKKATGLYVKFYQSSFKAIMDYPTGQIAEIPENLRDSAVYINSITYGRLGILTLETNESVYDAQEMINKIFKTIFYSESKTFTSQEQSFLNGCDFKVYMIGGNGSTSVESFTGLDGFIQHIKKGTFSQDEPGTPIFCTFNHVKDNSPVSVNFKFSVKKEPLYVELVHKPLPLPDPQRGQSFSKIRGYGNLYVYFYRDRAKVPTIAHPAIKINIIEKLTENQIKSGNIVNTNERTVTRVLQNAGYQTSMILSWVYYTGRDGRQLSKSDIYMYTYEVGRNPVNDIERIYEYWLEESDDYVILNTSPLTMENCPMSGKG
ncbi:hypothetical protein F2X94_15615 [Alistipes onderdonkii]|nr:thiol-activated cytolysin family protein [uncultured Alistipes sp.]KAA2438325.1 hypothetical protein F2X94_15615 [Alistipes onderdonkii]